VLRAERKPGLMKRKPSEYPRAWSWYEKSRARVAALARLIIIVLRIVDWWLNFRR
jgi:hypothetical protein